MSMMSMTSVVRAICIFSSTLLSRELLEIMSIFQLQATVAIIIIVFNRVSFSYTSSITRNFNAHAKLFAGGFGKSPSIKKKSNPETPTSGFGKSSSIKKESNSEIPKVTVPTTDRNVVRYVTRKGNGFCVMENHCESFNLLYPKIRAVHSDPPIFEIDDFFSKELCESYIARSTEGTEILCQPLAGSATTKRTSQTKYLKYENAQELTDAAVSLTGIVSDKYEEPQVVHYLPGNIVLIRILVL